MIIEITSTITSYYKKGNTGKIPRTTSRREATVFKNPRIVAAMVANLNEKHEDKQFEAVEY